MKLILASQSPRRKEILEKIKIPFQVRIQPVDEEVYKGEAPRIYSERMAETKALAVAEHYQDAVVIGADTIVVLEKEILGKPAYDGQAYDMLRSLSGKTHLVYTSVCLMQKSEGKKIIFSEKTEVDFAEISDQEIQGYCKTREPFDKAGAYGIQGYGAIFVTGIRGCFFNVMGLPLRRVYEELNTF